MIFKDVFLTGDYLENFLKFLTIPEICSSLLPTNKELKAVILSDRLYPVLRRCLSYHFGKALKMYKGKAIMNFPFIGG